MKNISDFSIEELELELQKRKTGWPPQLKDSTPEEIVGKIYKTVKGCVEDATVEGYWLEDSEQRIYESVMTAFYGDDFFSVFGDHWYRIKYNTPL